MFEKKLRYRLFWIIASIDRVQVSLEKGIIGARGSPIYALKIAKMTLSEVFFSRKFSELGLRNLGLPKRNRSDFVLRFHSISFIPEGRK